MKKIVTISALMTVYIVGMGMLATLSSVDSVGRYGVAVVDGWLEVSGRTGLPPSLVQWGDLRPLVPSEKKGALALMMQQERVVDTAVREEWQLKNFPSLGIYGWKGDVEDFPVYFVGGVPIQQMVLLNGAPHIRVEKASRSWIELAKARNIIDGFAGDLPVIKNRQD